jgi:hypothetical protein
VDLAAPFQNIDPFLGGDDRIAVEIGSALLKFGDPRPIGHLQAEGLPPEW